MSESISFFGATGGCTNAALVLALNAGYSCVALARTPQKLRDMLKEAGVDQATLDRHLRVVAGDAKDVAAVKDTLAGSRVVISGIGMNPFAKVPEKTICATATTSILQALRESAPARKPHVALISSTGISAGPRDVPLAFVPMYSAMLKTPHVDKRAMEELVIAEGNRSEAERAFAGWTLIRPSFLMSGDEKPSKVRTGSEQEPAVGYVINRKDVGRWIFDKLIVGDAKKWDGKKPSLTL